MRNVYRWLSIWTLLFLPLLLQAQQDIPIVGGTNPYIIIGRGIAWGGSGLGNLGNNFIFHPVNPDEGFCLFVSNNNPTNGHTFTVAVAQTGDPAINSFNGLAQKWNSVPSATIFPVTVPALSIVGINFKTTASAGIAVTFSGNTTQAGSPDTADVFAVQTTQSSCGAVASNAIQGPYLSGTSVPALSQYPVAIAGYDGSGVIRPILITSAAANTGGQMVSLAATNTNLGVKLSSTFSTVVAANGVAGTILQTLPLRLSGAGNIVAGEITDELRAHTQFSNSFYTTTSTSNPGAASTLLHIFCTGSCGTVQGTLVRLRIACQATTPTNCDFEILKTSAVGSTCTTPTVGNMLIGNTAAGSTVTLQTACGTPPTAVANSTMMKEFIASNTTAVIDLSGFMINGPTSSGVLIRNTTALTTGIMNVSLEWAEE